MEELEIKQKQEIVDAIKEDRLYDYIASNYWTIENDTLIQLLKECIYVLTTGKGYEDNLKQLCDNLKEFQDWEVK